MLYHKINTQKTAKRYLENLALSANNQRLCRHAAEPFSLSQGFIHE